MFLVVFFSLREPCLLSRIPLNTSPALVNLQNSERRGAGLKSNRLFFGCGDHAEFDGMRIASSVERGGLTRRCS